MMSLPEDVHRFSHDGPLSTKTAPTVKVRSSGVRDYLVSHMAKETRHQRVLDQERWVYLHERNSSTRGAWLEQLEQQMNDTRNRLEIRSSSVLTHPSGRPHTGYRITSARRNPSALVKPVRMNGKFQLDSREVAPSREAVSRLFNMYRGESNKLYHVAPDTVSYARGRTPEITPSLARPVNKHEIEAMIKTRVHQQSQRDKMRSDDDALAKSLRSSRVDSDRPTGGRSHPMLNSSENTYMNVQADLVERSVVSGQRVTAPDVSLHFDLVEESESTRLLQETLRFRASPPKSEHLAPMNPEPEAKPDDKPTFNSSEKVAETIAPDFAGMVNEDEPLVAQLSEVETSESLHIPPQKVFSEDEDTENVIASPATPSRRKPISGVVASPSSPNSSPSKRVRFAPNPVDSVAIIPQSTSSSDIDKPTKTRMSVRNRSEKDEEYKRETAALAAEVLVHSMGGTPKSILMLEKLGAKLMQQKLQPTSENDIDMGAYLRGNEIELTPVGDSEDQHKQHNQEGGNMEMEEHIESVDQESPVRPTEDEEQRDVDIGEPDDEKDLDASQTGMDDSINSSLNHSSMSEGTMQFEDASNAISAMLDAAEASATGILSTPERDKAKAAADEALAIAASKRISTLGRNKPKQALGSDQGQVPDADNHNKEKETPLQPPVKSRKLIELDDSRLNTPREPHKEHDDFLFNDDEEHGTNAEVSMISGLSMESSFAMSSATPGATADHLVESELGRGLQLNDLESSIMSKHQELLAMGLI